MMDNSLVDRLKPHWLPILLGVGGVIFLGYGLITLSAPKKDKPDILFEAASTRSDAGFAKDTKVISQITVDVEGAVQKPGVYHLPSEARVQDALIAAGGMSQDADREKISKALNLAAKLTDGGKIYIPVIGDPSTSSGLADQGSNVLGSDTSSATMNINTASASDLDKLPGVGEVTAQKIISNRPYGSPSELISKKVVSQKVYDEIKDKVSVY